jgi:hypothetical protein
MILAFKRSIKGDPTNFIDKIQHNEKVHTFRLGYRWSPGMPIHFYDGNPRAKGRVKPDPKPFRLPHRAGRCFVEIKRPGGLEYYPVATAIEEFKISFPNYVLAQDYREEAWRDTLKLEIAGYEIDYQPDYKKIIKNDGLPVELFEYFFYKAVKKNGKKKENRTEVQGQIIHWIKEPYFFSKAAVYRPAYDAARLPLFVSYGKDK